MASPDRLHMSNADFVTRQLTFKWSPVAPDCPAIHYNILTSNCGSCPTTTNHTNVTCTDIPTDGSTCTLAVQTVSCGYITGNASDPISITLYTQTPTTDDLHVYPTGKLTTHSSDTATEPAGTHPINSNSAVYVISIGSLATGLIASAVLFTTVTAIILRRSKVKVSAALELSQRGADGTTHDDPVYEEVAGASLHSIISTQDNVAYRHTKKVNTERITALITVP